MDTVEQLGQLCRQQVADQAMHDEIEARMRQRLGAIVALEQLLRAQAPQGQGSGGNATDTGESD